MFLRQPATDKTDEELIGLYRSTHDLAWLSALYLRYTSLVYGVCLKYLRDREEAKDAVMQVHEKLIKSLLEHEVASFRNWVYVSARNHCLMQLRSKRTHPTEEITPFLVESDPSQHPDDEPALETRLNSLEKCLETLEMHQQQCVRLFYLREKSYQEIATETGFESRAVKSYIQNGKRNLKICMDQHGQ